MTTENKIILAGIALMGLGAAIIEIFKPFNFQKRDWLISQVTKTPALFSQITEPKSQLIADFNVMKDEDIETCYDFFHNNKGDSTSIDNILTNITIS